MSAIYDSSGNLLLQSSGGVLQIGDSNLTLQIITPPGEDIITDPSLGSQFYWDAGLLNVVDVSGVTPDVTRAYVDGSLATRDSAISQNAGDIADVSSNIPSDFYSQAYVDGSLGERDSDISSLETSKLDASLISEGTPPNQSAPGIQGQIQYDALYLYICTSTNTWFRVPGEYTFGVI